MFLAIVFNVALAVHNAMPTTCEVIRDAKYLAQADDAGNTARLMPKREVPEIDPWAQNFGRRDPYVVFISDAVLDVVGDALTRHNPSLRCAVDAYELHAAVNGILYTNGYRP